MLIVLKILFICYDLWYGGRYGDKSSQWNKLQKGPQNLSNNSCSITFYSTVDLYFPNNHCFASVWQKCITVTSILASHLGLMTLNSNIREQKKEHIKS